MTATMTSRMKKGGDLYRHPLTREEMTAPLAWHEKQLAVCRRYGVLADGSIGYEVADDSAADDHIWTCPKHGVQRARLRKVLALTGAIDRRTQGVAPTKIVDLLRSFTDKHWRELARDAKCKMPSEFTAQLVVDVYVERSKQP